MVPDLLGVATSVAGISMKAPGNPNTFTLHPTPLKSTNTLTVPPWGGRQQKKQIIVIPGNFLLGSKSSKTPTAVSAVDRKPSLPGNVVRSSPAVKKVLPSKSASVASTLSGMTTAAPSRVVRSAELTSKRPHLSVVCTSGSSIALNDHSSLQRDQDQPPRKRANLEHMSTEQKLMRRKLKNRVAAQNARDKKRAKIDEMEDTIKALTERTAFLEKQNQRLNELNRRLMQCTSGSFSVADEEALVEIKAPDSPISLPDSSMSYAFYSSVLPPSPEPTTPAPTVPDNDQSLVEQRSFETAERTGSVLGRGWQTTAPFGSGDMPVLDLSGIGSDAGCTDGVQEEPVEAGGEVSGELSEKDGSGIPGGTGTEMAFAQDEDASVKIEHSDLDDWLTDLMSISKTSVMEDISDAAETCVKVEECSSSTLGDDREESEEWEPEEVFTSLFPELAV